MFLGFHSDPALPASAGLGQAPTLFLRILAWALELLEIFSPTVPSLPHSL